MFSSAQVSNLQGNSFYQHQAKTVRELVLWLLNRAARSVFSAAGGEESRIMTSNLLQHMRCVYQARLLASASCDLEVSTVPLDLLGSLDHIRQTGT